MHVRVLMFTCARLCVCVGVRARACVVPLGSLPFCVSPPEVQSPELAHPFSPEPC